jgi:delta1-piperideine-2-carboxylate reductase
LLIVIDPNKGSGQSFAERSEELVRQMHGVGQERLPGDRRYVQRARSLVEGIEISKTEWLQLRELAGD